MGNDLELVTDEFAIDISDDKNALLAALGQDGVTEQKQSGPASLRINYDADTEEGHTLKRGTWKVWNGKENVYSDSVLRLSEGKIKFAKRRCFYLPLCAA